MTHQSTKGGDRGFTLIELMVVVLVIAILLAIAIPTFTGARTRAQDSVAKSSLTITAKAAQVLAVDSGGAFLAATADCATLPVAEPSLTYVHGTAAVAGGQTCDDTANGASASAKQISIAPSVGTTAIAGTDSSFVAAALSSGGTCFYIIVGGDGQTYYAKDASTPVCTANAATGFAVGTGEAQFSTNVF
jgi:type IV pilus assembly protein PilA